MDEKQYQSIFDYIVKKSYPRWKLVLLLLSIINFVILQFCSTFSKHQFSYGFWKKLYRWRVFGKSHSVQRDGSSCGVFVMKVLFSKLCSRSVC